MRSPAFSSRLLRKPNRAAGALVAGALTFAAALPARADVGTSIGTGGLLTSDGKNGGGIVGTIGLGSFPVIPIRPQISGTYMLGQGSRYALLGEGQFGGRTFFVGGGAGIGRFRQTFSQTSPMFDVFAGLRVAPYTSVQLRLYGSPNEAGGGATFLGVTFGL